MKKLLGLFFILVGIVGLLGHSTANHIIGALNIILWTALWVGGII
jgi:hypothetical protein